MGPQDILIRDMAQTVNFAKWQAELADSELEVALNHREAAHRVRVAAQDLVAQLARSNHNIPGHFYTPYLDAVKEQTAAIIIETAAAAEVRFLQQSIQRRHT